MRDLVNFIKEGWKVAPWKLSFMASAYILGLLMILGGALLQAGIYFLSCLILFAAIRIDLNGRQET